MPGSKTRPSEGLTGNSWKSEEIARELFPKACAYGERPASIGIARHDAAGSQQQAFEATAAPEMGRVLRSTILSSRPGTSKFLATLDIAYVDVEPRSRPAFLPQATHFSPNRGGPRPSARCGMPGRRPPAADTTRSEDRLHLDEYPLAPRSPILPISCRRSGRRSDHSSPHRQLWASTPSGTSQDSDVKQAVRRHSGSLAVTTPCSYGRYIGSYGEHFTPSIFADSAMRAAEASPMKSDARSRHFRRGRGVDLSRRSACSGSSPSRRRHNEPDRIHLRPGRRASDPTPSSWARTLKPRSTEASKNLRSKPRIPSFWNR